MLRARLLRCVRVLIAIGILFLLIKRLSALLAEIKVEAITFQPIWLIVSLILLCLYFGGLGILWLFLYRTGRAKSRQLQETTHLTRKEQISFLSGWTFFQLSQFGKYLPGRVGPFVWMLSFSGKFGIENASAVLATFLQLAFQCSLGCIIGIPALYRGGVSFSLPNPFASFQISERIGVLSLGVMMLSAGAVFLYRRGIGKRIGLLIKQSLGTILSVSGTLALASYLLLWCLLGAAFFLFIKSLYPVDFSQLLVITSCYAAAWNIGFLSFVTPSGLGVREGVLSLLLTTVVPPATATLIALLARLWTLSVELSLGGLAFGLYFKQRQHQKQV